MDTNRHFQEDRETGRSSCFPKLRHRVVLVSFLPIDSICLFSFSFYSYKRLASFWRNGEGFVFQNVCFMTRHVRVQQTSNNALGQGVPGGSFFKFSSKPY